MSGAEHLAEPSSSQQLLSEHANGNDHALRTLLVRHLRPLRAFVRLQIGPALRARETESDVLQNVCLEVLQRAARFEFQSETAFRGWLYRAVMNVVRNDNRYYQAQRRSPQREEPMPDSEELLAQYSTIASPSRHAAAREEVARIEAAFARLPPRYAEVLALTHVVGQPREEIAATLGISVEAVSQLHRRARFRLAREMEKAQQG